MSTVVTASSSAASGRVESRLSQPPLSDFGGYRADYQDDCPTETKERARSSPIFVEYREGATE